MNYAVKSTSVLACAFALKFGGQYPSARTAAHGRQHAAVPPFSLDKEDAEAAAAVAAAGPAALAARCSKSTQRLWRVMKRRRST